MYDINLIIMDFFLDQVATRGYLDGRLGYHSIVKDSYIQIWHVSQPSEHFGAICQTGVTYRFYEKSIQI